MLKKCLAALIYPSLLAFSLNASAAAEATAVPGKTAHQVVIAQVNLNTADVATLESELVGIGQSKAQAIVDHRDANGPFASVDELLEVKGIGPATLEKNRDKLSVN